MEKNKLSAEPVKKIWNVQFNFNNVSFEQYLTNISGIHALLKKIMSNEAYAGAYIWQHVSEEFLTYIMIVLKTVNGYCKMSSGLLQQMW
jgi:type IV secretory pathway VirB6-like protein